MKQRLAVIQHFNKKKSDKYFMQKIIRFATIAIVFMILINSLAFIIIGIYKSINAYIIIGEGSLQEKPGILIAESLDSFLIALFFIIFSIGISKLFLPESKFIKESTLPWLKIESFSALKLILWEVLLTTLFVYFGSAAIIAGDHLEWTSLIIPASILMLSLAYKLLKQGH